MRNFENVKWKDFYLSEFFCCEKGNQNNMASLTAGDIPLISAKKCDNGYKDFIAPNRKKTFRGNIITLNNDGDGGAGIAYYQPYTMALDSHVTALIPLSPLSRHVLLFVAMCITKQRNRFGHGYSLNNNRLRSFKLMLPLNEETTAPDWQFMEDYMKQKEQQILKPTIEKLCKRLIIKNILMGGGVNRYAPIGKPFILQKYLQRYSVVSDSKKQTTQKGIFPMCHQHRLIMALTDLSAMMMVA